MTLKYKQILIAVDGSDGAHYAFRKSVEIAKRNNAVLNLIYVVDTRSSMVMTKRIPDPTNAFTEYGKELLEDYKKEALETGVLEVKTFVAPGSPKTVISHEYAKRVNADLIVCGAQGLNALEHFFMGSVSEHIVRSSSCDVLVVRKVDSKKAEGQIKTEL
ncbi:universal stress protein [Planococcus sp. N064]|uniref:Universal stress protein n=1 Tax=Planococcus liqunii TaxID=3058394 RepID=A0ABT8MSY0_9BACL|nr:universal stress protein [Planococcus sp. N064]MDN7228022.1 universal stress protein [Planococcus sp. N064]